MQGAHADLIEVIQKALAMDSRAVGDGEESVNLIVDNVAEMPLAALPRIGKIPGGNLGVVANAAAESLKGNVDRRSDVRACRFGQNAKSVVVRDVISERRPEIVNAVRQHTGLSG